MIDWLYPLFADQVQIAAPESTLHYVLTALLGGSATGAYALIQWVRKRTETAQRYAENVLSLAESVAKYIAVLSVHAPQLIETLQRLEVVLQNQMPSAAQPPTVSDPDQSPSSAP